MLLLQLNKLYVPNNQYRMKINSEKTWIIGLLFLISTQVFALQDSTKEVSPFSFNASYIGDVVSNFDGGIKTGTNYLGKANISLGFDTKKAGWWTGGEFYTKLLNTHGNMPSVNLIGDFQTASNIEAGNITNLYELWYNQTLGKFDITVGLQDLNVNYVTTENGGLFLNSSFGVYSVMSKNITLPIFPLTALGATIQWNVSKHFNWQVALFDGTPNSRNPYNTNCIISKKDGYLIVSEFQLAKSLVKGQEGTYKVGIYYHEQNYSVNEPHQNDGIYFIADQDINRRFSAFTQIGFSPNSINKHNHFYSLGVNYKAFSNKRSEDKMGLAIAYAGIDDNNIRSETAIELTYKLQMNENIYLQPDIQYIINPAGTEVKLNNALVGFLRFGLEF